MDTPEHIQNDPLSVLVVSFQRLPSESVLNDIAPYFQKIAWHYAGKISRHREDRQDFSGDILAKMLDVLNRPVGHKLSRYNPARGSARGFFESVARTEAWNIGSARRTRAKNLEEPLSTLLDYGPFMWVEYDYE